MKKQKSFVHKIKKAFIFNAIVPVFLLLILFAGFLLISSEQSVKNKTRAVGRQIGAGVAGVHRNYRSESLRMARDEATLHFLETGKDSSLIFEKYYANVLQQEIVFEIAILDLEDNVLLKSSKQDGYQIGTGIIKLQNLGKAGSRGVEMLYSKVKTDFGMMYFYGFGTVIYLNDKPAGYLIYYTSDQMLKQLIEIRGAEEVVLVNQFDTVLATTTGAARSTLNKLAFQETGNGSFYLEGAKFYLSRFYLEDDEICVITINSLQMERYIFQLLPVFILVVMAVLCIVLNVLADGVSRKVTEPIELLLKVVRKNREGDLLARIELDTGDEFETLAEEYNSLLLEIQDLLERNRTLFELQRETEFTVLRNQFNPHFIFNVLETLRYTLLTDSRQAEHIVLNLSKLLRYSIYATDPLIPVREDIEHLRAYLELHKARFQERMSFTLEVPEELDEIPVPKFFIQPFVENSIKHGFRTRSRFQVRIRLVRDENHLTATVEDDGGGMTPERYREVQERLLMDEMPEGHVGIYNINRTLKLIYGEEYGIRLVNSPGEGLTVIMRIPIIGAEKEV